jgi:hypothetical protein
VSPRPRKPPRRKAKRVGAKHAAKRTPVARRKPAAQPSRRARPARAKAPRKATPARRARRPALAIVRRPAPRRKRAPRPSRPFEGALASASAKDLALFDLVRARVEIHAAVQGMAPASADTPIAEGKWSPRQILLHLHYWDREMLPWVERAWQQNRRPPHTMEQILSENEAAQVALSDQDWESTRRLMQQSREELLEALQSLPEEPAERWSSEHALGWLVRLLAHHDRHHAAKIKEARGGTSAGA